MTHDREDPLFPHAEKSMLQKLLPPLILMAAFGGFVSLAIYAYKAGTQSVSEEELMVVEADTTVMKEKPEDPGGMQFPNQNKTIFETIASGNAPLTPNVERVLPTPEEPMPKDADTSGTTTWVNDKLADHQPTTPATSGVVEQVFSEDAASAAIPTTPVETQDTKVVNIQEELGKQAVAEPAPTPSAVTAAPVNLQPASPKIEAPKEPFNPPKKAEKPVEKKTVTKSSGGKQIAQLGAYKEEAVARADFARLQKKYPALADKSPTINRADLGDKGVFYRLRVATDDAKKLCAALAGQACMAVK